MRYLFFLTLFFSLGAQAQWKEFKLTKKGDTINRVDQRGLRQGPWIVRVEPIRGEPGYEEEGIYYDGRKEGSWRRFNLEDDVIAEENYHYDMKHGKCKYYLPTGELLREESWRAIDPQHPYDTVAVRDIDDPSKILKYVVQKVEPKSYMHGTWTYYNTLTGNVDNTEEYVMNRLKADIEAEAAAAADDMAPSSAGKGKTAAADGKEKKPMPKPQAILDYEKKNSGKKKVKVRDGSTGG